ncbi:MAG: 23S rRNA (adenine(2503)-C(2))-methyltransferase RlmN, partial [Lachnospiraceae bacterium]|nr:23S rRNA (adenine(2503)-C(2))-methyltransferase RlmN [Lachnospiraceae bacterium]
MKKDLLSLLPEEREAEIVALGAPKYRSSQVGKWLSRGVRSFDEMSDLPKSLRDKLKDSFRIYKPKVLSKQVSA